MNTSIEADNMKEMVTLAERLGALLRSFVGHKEEQAVEVLSSEEETVLEEVPVVKESVVHNGQAGKKDKKPSQSDLVRQCISLHDKARNKDIIDIIKRDHGIEVAASLVSYIKSKEASKSKAHKASSARAHKASVAKAAPKKTGRMVSHSSLVREFLENNTEATNEEVVKEVRRSRKVEVKPTLVSSVRAILKRKGAKTGRIAATKPATKKGKGRKGLPMPALVVKVLEKSREGMKLREMTEKVIAAGYEYGGNKGWEGITQNVYQAVHALSKTVSHAGYEGTIAVVLHDEASKRWKLNPKAMKKRVA